MHTRKQKPPEMGSRDWSIDAQLALTGIAEPADFMSLVRELCDGIEEMGVNNVGQNVMMLKDKLVALLPKENQ